MRNGHLRFQLRRDRHSLPVIVLSVTAQYLPFRVENRQQLIVEGQIQVYRPWGQLELVAGTVQLEEQAEIQETLSALKERAEALGWLKPERKRALPCPPKNIGLITSSGSLARADVMGSLEDAHIESKILPATANVEGPDAAQEVKAALQVLNEHPSNVDLIVIARGGGGPTNLWGFDDWDLAHAIVHSRAPVLTAIGHRQDETLADLVADERAHTPSMVGSMLASKPPPPRPVEPLPVSLPPERDEPKRQNSAIVAILAAALFVMFVLFVFAWFSGWF